MDDVAAEIDRRLATLDAEQLRLVVRHLAVHHAYAVEDTLEWASFHRAHPKLCREVAR